MTTELFQKLMHANLFSTDGDDARLEKIRAAAAALETTLSEDASLFLDAVLAASNPQATPALSSMAAAAAALEAQWPSYVSFYTTPPANIFRAMLISAVFAVASKTDARAQCLTLLLRNIVPRRQWKSEATFWEDEMHALDRAHEAKAAKLWADNLNGPAGPLPGKPAVRTAKVDRAKLQAILLSSVGPQGGDEKNPHNPHNPHWPGDNEPWAQEFAKRATPALADLIDEAASSAVNGRAAIDKVLFDVLEQRLPNAEGVQRRTRLLWWKEANYSASADRGYDELSPALAVSLMPKDVCEVTGSLAPRSTEYFVRNAVVALAGGDEQSIKEFGKALGEANDRAMAEPLLQSAHADLLLSTILSAVRGDKAAPPALFTATEKLSSGELAVVMLREYQALRALGVSS